MGKVPGACDCRRKRGCHACATAHDASTLCTVPRDLHHGQASRCGLHATPWWQAPVCVAPLLSPPAEQRAVRKALLHPATNAAGWRQCRGQTGFSQLNNPQINPQRRAFSLNLRVAISIYGSYQQGPPAPPGFSVFLTACRLAASLFGRCCVAQATAPTPECHDARRVDTDEDGETRQGVPRP